MGAQQSKTVSSQMAAEKLIVERLKALQVKQQLSEADDDYVCVDSNEKQTKTAKYVPKSPLSISAVEHWQHELLQDPKNRCVIVPVLRHRQEGSDQPQEKEQLVVEEQEQLLEIL